MKVTVYTDGSCIGNPGRGGWAAKLHVELKNGGVYAKTLSGNEAMTTNNRMELTAVVKAVEALRTSCTVHMHSDSAYVVNNYNRIPFWAARRWRTADGKEVKNRDLWEKLDRLVREKGVDIRFQKVAGHTGVAGNEEMDTIARWEASRLVR
jgi:ribonuclease HI